LEYVKREAGMKDQLTTTSYAVLAQVAVRPWSTYELVQQRVRYLRYVWPRAESAIYREAKRLSSMGLIEGKKEYTGKRARTVYSITREGKEVLGEWLGTPISPFSMDFEAMLRVFVAPLGTKDDIIGTLEQVRADAQEMLRFAGEVKQEFIDGINVTQEQVYIRALAVDFFISLLNTVEFASFPSIPQKRHSKTYPYPQRDKRGSAPDTMGLQGNSEQRDADSAHARS
jgi:DNA-binding PadR family transcriptional regulator